MFACWLKRLRAGVSATSPRAGVPGPAADGRDDGVGALAVARRPLGLAEGGLEVRRLAQREGELERDRHRAAVLVLRAARRPRTRRTSPRSSTRAARPRRPSGRSLLREPVEHRPRAGELAPHERRVVAPRPVVVDHAHPQQRERRDELLRRARVAAVGDPLGAPRALEGLDRLAREAVVAGHGVGDERLDARVAHVLQLLVVGAVHVGLVRAGAGGAPAHLPEARRASRPRRRSGRAPRTGSR